MADIIRYNPFRMLDQMRNEMDRIFADFFGDLPEAANGSYDVIPAVDIYSTGEELVFIAEMPGLEADDIEITTTEDTINIAGEIKAPAMPDNARRIRAERTYGKFNRAFRLPVPIEPEKVQASFKNGVLEVRLPLAERVKPRSVKIQIENK
ncbi:MAG: hypothetical protein PWP48_1599 [Clostridiales bacterium]|jgi:HSP20 family protein|nr:hypothetical protein [Clostridiales bacterium]MDK2992366.1 hypothetical protein [Clostridiales bacterium]